MKSHDLSPDGCGVTALGERCDASLPDNPQCTLNYHFGMLLGVDDFQAEQGFHLGRSRRHQRLLHGAGVVAGYQVLFEEAATELRVLPGLAVDPLGRELVLEADQCVNLVKWWLQHRGEEAYADLPSLDDATFDLDLLVCYATCLSSPVPAIAEPCAGQASDIAYSRVCETVTLKLVRALPVPAAEVEAPALTPWPHDRLSLAEVLSTVDIARPDDTRPGELCVPLARLRGLHLLKDAQGWSAQVAGIDLGVRPLLLPTGVLQSVLLPQLMTPALPAGPLVAEGGATLSSDDTVSLVFDQALALASVQPAAFAVSEFDAALGWRLFTIVSATYAAPTTTVALQLDRPVTGVLLRVSVIGTGSTPLLGDQLLPAGAPHQGSDGRLITITIHRG